MDREQEQRERAYQIWEEEGRPFDKHEEHWERAGRDTGLSAKEADEVTEANEVANSRFAGEGREVASVPQLKLNPD